MVRLNCQIIAWIYHFIHKWVIKIFWKQRMVSSIHAPIANKHGNKESTKDWFSKNVFQPRWYSSPTDHELDHCRLITWKMCILNQERVSPLVEGSRYIWVMFATNVICSVPLPLATLPLNNHLLHRCQRVAILETLLCTFSINKNSCTAWKFSFASMGLIGNMPVLVQIMACSRRGDKPIPKLLLTWWWTH